MKRNHLISARNDAMNHMHKTRVLSSGAYHPVDCCSREHISVPPGMGIYRLTDEICHVSIGLGKFQTKPLPEGSSPRWPI